MQQYTYGHMFGRVEVTTAPASEPISTAEAKAWLKIETGTADDDSLIDLLVTMARKWVEDYLDRKLINQTLTQTLDDWPSGRSRDEQLPAVGRVDDVLESDLRYVELLQGPVSSVTSITTYDDADSSSVWSSSLYRLSTAGENARVVPVGSASWPTATRDSDAVEIVYVAGYGATGADVPAPIRLAMYELIAHWYEHREATVDYNLASAPLGVASALEPYRKFRL